MYEKFRFDGHCSGGGDSLNRIRQGFTLGELTITLIVITIVVIVTLPITISKMKKVDYNSYYMGYSLMKDISANALPEILELINNGEKDCFFEVDDTCYGQPFKGEYMTYSECYSDRDLWGIKYRCSYNLAQGDGTKDYWAGAVKKCGGVDKMPTLAQIARIADYIYGTSGAGSNDWIYEKMDKLIGIFTN